MTWVDDDDNGKDVSGVERYPQEGHSKDNNDDNGEDSDEDDLDRDDHKVALLSPADRRVQEVDLSPPSLHERDYQKSSNSSTISLPATVLITTSYFLGDLHGIAAPTPEPQLSTSTTSP